MAIGPQLIILDEALSNLDRVLQVQILDLLTQVRRESGTGFLLITHDLSLVQRFCQRVVVLAEGKLVEDMPVTAPDALYPPCCADLAGGSVAGDAEGPERS